MFNNQDIFYFGTIRKITAAFGTLFDDIYIHRYSENAGTGTILKSIKVPLSYAENQKWLGHRQEDITAPKSLINPKNSKTRIRMSLPRISFELTNLQYDPNRKLQTINAIQINNEEDVSETLKQLVPFPCDIGFDLNISVKNIDDGLQIIEQILPNFVPSFNLNIKEIPELGIIKDVPVILGGISKMDTYEGSYEDERVITWTLNFVVKGYIYPCIKGASIIRKAIASIYQQETMENKESIIVTEIDPSDASKNEDWEAKTTIYDAIDSNGDPI